MLQSKNRAGQLDKEIIIIQPTVATGTANSDRITGWTTFATVWAKKKDSPGSEQVVDDRVVYAQTTTWTIRYLSGLTQLMRIRFNGKIYEIISITDDGSRDRWQEVVTSLLDSETT